MRSVIKCRFCGWKTAKWTTTAQGKRVEGYTKLLSHVELEHPEELKKVMKCLASE